jgi:hypothetical protein
MAPIVQGQKRYTVLEKALKTSKITQQEFDYCISNGVAFSVFKISGKPEDVPPPVSPEPEELPLPTPTLVAPSPEELPLPSPTLVAPPPSPAALVMVQDLTMRQFEAVSPKSPMYDVEAARELPLAPIKKRKRFTEPFHGGVALMSLQEKFDALADKVLQDTEEGIRREQVEQEVQEETRSGGWWGFSLLGR